MTKKGVIYLVAVLLCFCSACGKTSDNTLTPTLKPIITAMVTPVSTEEPNAATIPTIIPEPTQKLASAPTPGTLTEDEKTFSVQKPSIRDAGFGIIFCIENLKLLRR